MLIHCTGKETGMAQPNLKQNANQVPKKKERFEWLLSFILAWLQEKGASQSSPYPKCSPHFAFTEHTDHYLVLFKSLKSVYQITKVKDKMSNI